MYREFQLWFFSMRCKSSNKHLTSFIIQKCFSKGWKTKSLCFRIVTTKRCCTLVLISVAGWGPTSGGALVYIIKPPCQKDMRKFTCPLDTSITKLYYLWFPHSTFKNSSTFSPTVELFHTIFSSIFYYNSL